MRLKIFFAMVFVALLALSCEDKEKENTVDCSKAVAGLYEGSISLSVMDQEQGSFDAKVRIDARNDNTVKVTLVGGVGEGAMRLGEISVENVKVTTNDQVTYNLVETAVNTTVEQVAYTGTLKGFVKNNKAEVTFTVKPGAMPMDVCAKFTGEK